MINREQLIDAYAQLGTICRVLGQDEDFVDRKIGITEDEYVSLQNTINKQVQFNGWFTPENVRQALLALSFWLTPDELTRWTQGYSFGGGEKKIAIVMAGNIPLVGFHDLLSVSMMGNSAVCKLSSNDKTLLPALMDILFYFLPDLKPRIQFMDGVLGEIHAVIATGSTNTSRYFDYYFGKYPHLFRQNRTSIAVLNGKESPQQLESLGDDIFSYFGMGCRNVSHLLVPKNYDFSAFFSAILSHQKIIYHHKYANNYDYNKAILLMNKVPLIDNNFVLLRETEDLHAPLSLIHYHFYDQEEEINDYITKNNPSIQVIVGDNYVPFGNAQKPTLTDYADGINTLEWQEKLSKISGK